MQSHLINYLFSSKTIQVLFWTLMHSLWQGIVFALLAALILMSTKRSGTALRYKLLSSVLISFIIVSLFTFCYQIYSVPHYTNTSVQTAIIFSNNITVTNNHSGNFIEKLIAVLQQYENSIVLIWLVIILIKCLGLIRGLCSVHVLKHRQVFDAGEYWDDRLKTLAAIAGIKKQILLLKSTIAKVPMVLGYFKPVILFPAAALTALAPEEIEAILLHELAHIRRKDYLINIFQRMAEIIFFFNPAVLWVSSLIKEERENCCDDIAVQQTNNKKQFIHALVSFQEYNAAGYAASFSGRKNFLLNRIKRIITNNNKTLNTMEKTFLAAGIAITALTAFAFSQHKQSFKNISARQSAQIAYTSNKKDTVPQKKNDNGSTYTFSSAVNGKQYKLVEVNGKVTELYVDNVKIPGDKISDYDSIINKLNENLEAIRTQNEAVKAQSAMVLAGTLATDAQAKAKVQAMKAQAKELQQEMARVKMENDSDKIQGKMEALNAQAELLEQKALTINESKDQAVKIKLEALEAVPVKAQVEKLEAIANEQALILDLNNKQSKIINDKTEKIINQELKIQIQQLKQQNEELKQQLNQKDSLRVTPDLPRGA
jgi:bla regulator protein BlaR1